ncbi:RAMP superfamily CRISPR-associated protein [Desulfonatronospira sp.]|uniref:RAMP superfamily CRISPR-associated protein n=1 Tax=Desulfonatronospira sp. TaxID=1962951 RepID=UPI0025C3E395|nr:RAMP superfamily CRISPR-associated protein [Desulfonatronospira sp.]
MILTRFNNIEKLKFTVEFLSPTFLGGADQNAELRSAPFKNLLRQWWRIALGDLETHDLRKQEGRLFGSVSGNDSAEASKVRLSLLPNNNFKISESMSSIGTLKHPEVKNRQGRLIPLERLLYLGYGPIYMKPKEGGGPKLGFRRFITPGSNASLRIYCPKQNHDEILQAMSLIHHFGTIGGRSRNGFGSIALSCRHLLSFESVVAKAKGFDLVMGFSEKKYPSALSKDSKGLLCWEYSQNDMTWENVFKIFSEIYMLVRTSFPFKQRNTLEPRHILGYPAGRNHHVHEWGGATGRRPSQLRLMVKRNDQGQVIGRILHLPHPMHRWNTKIAKEAELWKKVHAFLDARNELQRCGGGQ